MSVQLTKVKHELHQTLDAGFTNAESYRVGFGNECVDYTTPPSVFLEKAYTLQTYDGEGRSLENREQPYIDEGVAFTSSVEDTTNREKIILNDAGALTSAINNILSQLNKISAELNKISTGTLSENEVETLGHLIANPVALQNQIEVLVDLAQRSPMINYVPRQNIFQLAISAIVELFQSMLNYLSQLGKTETQRNQQRFFAVQAKYSEIPACASPSSQSDSDSDEVAPMLSSSSSGHAKSA